uniref:Versican b n=1 Tax=Neolamprologus brichardi TaxID=32507 RepID=A0A3Q4GJ32_NEOBR
CIICFRLSLCILSSLEVQDNSTLKIYMSSDDYGRIKWTKLDGQEEKVVLVAQGLGVKLGHSFESRVSVLSYPQWLGDASLVIGKLRASDAGLYRCEVMHGLESTQVTVILTVRGVVFHYRASSSRYSLNYSEAVEACHSVDASIATPEQLTAAYEDGLDQCDAGWLADQSVRYPLTVTRPGCEGNLKNRPGVRTYGIRDPMEKYDVYCYVDKLHGEVFYPTSISSKLTWQQAREECEKHDAVLASPGHLFAAWRAGLNRCDFGWLSDGSVRYPITIPRPQCGGGQLGVRTLYKYENQTGYPDPTDRHGAFCFKGKTETYIDPNWTVIYSAYFLICMNLVLQQSGLISIKCLSHYLVSKGEKGCEINSFKKHVSFGSFFRLSHIHRAGFTGQESVTVILGLFYLT